MRVHLSVSYGRAQEFVREYAENLSAGGMFITGAAGLDPLEEVQVAVALPGYDSFRVIAEVCHVITPEQGQRIGHRPGVGVQIKEAPPEFHDALRGYLARLGRRADYRVLVTEAEVREALGAAGYQTGPAPDPGGLVLTVARSPVPVLAVVVRPGERAEYDAAAVAAGDPELVMVCEGARLVGDVLAALDERL